MLGCAQSIFGFASNTSNKHQYNRTEEGANDLLNKTFKCTRKIQTNNKVIAK